MDQAKMHHRPQSGMVHIPFSILTSDKHGWEDAYLHKLNIVMWTSVMLSWQSGPYCDFLIFQLALLQTALRHILSCSGVQGFSHMYLSWVVPCSFRAREQTLAYFICHCNTRWQPISEARKWFVQGYPWAHQKYIDDVEVYQAPVLQYVTYQSCTPSCTTQPFGTSFLYCL